MSATTPKPAYREIYVTVAANGPRYYYWSRRADRLLPLKREVAEQAFAAGATVYRKQPGTNIWQDGGATIITEAVSA